MPEKYSLSMACARARSFTQQKLHQIPIKISLKINTKKNNLIYGINHEALQCWKHLMAAATNLKNG